MTGSPSSELNIRPRWWPALVICARSTGAKKPPTGTSSGWRSEPPPGINRARLAKQALANGWQPGTIAAPQVGNRQPKFFNDAGVVELVDTRDLKFLIHASSGFIIVQFTRKLRFIHSRLGRRK